MATFTGLLGTPGWFKLAATTANLVVPFYTAEIGRPESILSAIELGRPIDARSSGPQVYTFSMHHTLTFTQSAPKQKVAIRSVSHTLTFTQSTPHSRCKNLFFTQMLHFTQLATKQRRVIRSVHQTLGLHQVASRSVTYHRAASNVLHFNDYTIKQTSMLGQTVIIPTAVATVVSTNPKKQFVILEIPDRAISLPPPEFNDGEALTDTVIVKRSMNNVLYSWVRKNDLRKLRYTFPLGRPKALELRDFVYASIGQIIKMTNWKGEIWMVNITNNPVELVLKSRYVDERELANISVEFQGIKIAG